MEHRSWNDTTAADVISDILKMKEYAENQRIFVMNNATKEKVTHGTTDYDGVITINNSIPDDIILSSSPSALVSAVPGSANIIQLSEKKLPEIKLFEGNRKQRREAERERKRRTKRK